MSSNLPARVLPAEMQEMIELTRDLAPQTISVQSQTGMFDFGDKDLKATLTGVILGDVRPRGYWVAALEDGIGPPDCSSADGRVPLKPKDGKTVQHATCAGCPQDEWGSSPKGGNAKGCKQSAIVIVLQPGAIAPIAVKLSATSIRSLDTYYQKLLSKAQGFSMVMTEFSLESRKSSGGIPYSVLLAKKLRDVTEEEGAMIAAIKPYVPKFKQMLSGAKPESAAPEGAVDSEVVEDKDVPF